MAGNLDEIKLTLPFKAEYVSVVRLAVSGIGARMKFDIETIEDMKVAVSEACNKLIETAADNEACYTIAFKIYKDELTIIFSSDDLKSEQIFMGDEDNELGVAIINAFMDSVEISTNDDYILSMTKSVEGVNGYGE
jgi:serine/threonine-protein kinase RsbW